MPFRTRPVFPAPLQNSVEIESSRFHSAVWREELCMMSGRNTGFFYVALVAAIALGGCSGGAGMGTPTDANGSGGSAGTGGAVGSGGATSGTGGSGGTPSGGAGGTPSGTGGQNPVDAA